MKKSLKGILCLSLMAFSILLNPNEVYAKDIEETEENAGELDRVVTDINNKNFVQNRNVKMTLDNEQLVEANELYIDGELIGIYSGEDTIKEIINNISELYKENENQEVRILNNIEIKDILTVQSVIYESEDIYNRLLKNEYRNLTIVVEKGTNLESIIDKYEIDYKELEELNPKLEKKLNKIEDEKKEVRDLIFKEDSELVVKVRETYLDIEVFQYEDQIEKIDYESIEEYSDEIYEGERKIYQEGKKGILEKKIKVANINFGEIKKSLVSQKITKEPINEVILIGTKEKGSATGSFMMPCNGNLTSGYGPRWGGFHTGIDLANPMGTPIYSSDGGIVIEAGWDGSYGNKITIDHDNGFKTVYAHLSSIDVNIGDKLAKGQYIGAMGSTGYSTGSHLHFEIRINDQHVNPYNYL